MCFALGRENTPAIVTTTTHMAGFEASLADSHLRISPEQQLLDVVSTWDKKGLCLVTGHLNPADEKLTTPTQEQLRQLHLWCSQTGVPLIIEADGAKHRLIKTPAEHEPAIPDFVQTVVVVANLTALGQPLGEGICHRPAQFARLAGSALGEPLKASHLAAVLSHPHGGLKGKSAERLYCLALTGADTERELSAGAQIGEICQPDYAAVVICQLHTKPVRIHSVRQQVAGVILAAGASSRLGRPKPLEPLFGRPFVWWAARSAIEAGLSPVIVVTGVELEKIAAALEGLPVQLAHNGEWKEGQASSIRAGVACLPDACGAAIFLMADQPQVTPTLLRALVEEHSKRLPQILAPMVGGKRANPVLFDRITFAALAGLAGDVGGRQLFTRFNVEYLEWLDGLMGLDVDTPEELELLTKLLKERGNEAN